MAEPGFRAGNILGDIIFGKPDGKVYADQMERNMRTAKLMEEARNARSRNLAMDELTGDKFSAAYNVSPEIAAVLSAGVRSQDSANFNVLGATPLQMQEHAMRKAAVAAGTPVLGEMNANLAGVAGKPVEMTRIDDGYVTSPYVLGDEPMPTGLTTAKIATETERRGQVEALRNKAISDAAATTYRAHRPAASVEEDAWRVELIEADLGRKLTAQELADLAANKLKVAAPPKFDGVLTGVASTEADAPLGREPKPNKAVNPSGGPKVGEVRKGYRYKGGDPASRTSWVKI